MRGAFYGKAADIAFIWFRAGHDNNNGDNNENMPKTANSAKKIAWFLTKLKTFVFTPVLTFSSFQVVLINFAYLAF